MQNETSLYEISPHLLLINYQGKRVGGGRELGEARVVSTMFGKAKVHIIRKQGHSGWLWLLVILVVLGVMAALVFWTMAVAPDTPEISSIAVIPVPIKPQTPPEVSVPAPQNLSSQLPVTPITSPTTEKNITAQSTVTRSVIQQPEKTEFTEQTPTKKRIASKPKALPPDTGDDQPELPVEMESPVKPQAAAPLSIKPAATEPVLQITKTPPVRVVEPGSGTGANAATSAGSNQQPDAAETPPQGAPQ